MTDGLHRERTRRAAFNELSYAETRGSRNRRGRMRGFHGPDALLQPVDEREIVSSAAKDRLAKMDVGLDKARNHGAPLGVNNSVRCLPAAANRCDVFAVNE